jgi:hypothetical protein
MIQMRHSQTPRMRCAEFVQNPQQNHGIDPTGNGDQNRLSVLKKPLLPNHPLDLLNQAAHVNRLSYHFYGASRQGHLRFYSADMSQLFNGFPPRN